MTSTKGQRISTCHSHCLMPSPKQRVKTIPPEEATALSSQTGGLGIAQLDPAGLIISANPTLCQWHGQAEGALLGAHWSVLCGKNEIRRLKQVEFPRACAEGSASGMVELRTREGGVFCAEITLISTPGGGQAWICAPPSGADLPSLAPYSMRQMLSHASHAVRSPLTVATTAVQLLAASSRMDSARRKRHLTQVLGRLAEMEGILDDLAFLSKRLARVPMEAGEAEPVRPLLLSLTSDWRLNDPGELACVAQIDYPAEAATATTCQPQLVQLLMRNLLAICARCTAPHHPILISVREEEAHLRIRFESEGMVVPEQVARLLCSPLLLHSKNQGDSDLFLRFLIIGICLRARGGLLHLPADTAIEISLKP